MKLRRLVLFLPLLLCLPVCRLRAEEIYKIDAAMQKADPRLAQRVTLTEMRIPLGALLERLSAKTGVSLRMDTASNASGAMLLVVLHDQPLADTLNSLYAFFGYRNARWEWHRSGEAGKYAYYFTQTQSSRDLTATWKQQAQEAFLNHAKVMFELARMTPEERKRSADKLTHSLLDCDDYTGKSWVNDEEIWQALRAFQDSVKPEDQQKVLAGGEITVPMANLTREGKDFITEQASHTTFTVNGVPKPNVPEGVHFYTQWPAQNTSPIFFAGDMSQMAGVALQKGLNIRQSAWWLLEGDTKTHPADMKPIRAPETPYPTPVSEAKLAEMAAAYRSRSDLVGFRLDQMAHEMPQSLIAHLPDSQRVDPGASYGKTPANFLLTTRQSDIPIMWKWRGDTLLIEYPAWYLQQAQNIPYALWKPFAQTLAAHPGREALPLPVVAKTLAPLSEAQWKHLLVDAPFMEPARTLQGLFGLAVRFPDLLRENGAIVTPALAEDLRQTKPNAYTKPFKVSDAAQALRIHQALSTDLKDQMMVAFEVQDVKKVWHYVLGYTVAAKSKTP